MRALVTGHPHVRYLKGNKLFYKQGRGTWQK